VSAPWFPLRERTAPKVLLDQLAWWWLTRRHAEAQYPPDETVDEAVALREALEAIAHGGYGYASIKATTALMATKRAASSQTGPKAGHPGPPDVPGQEQCERCGGFLGDDAYGHSRMCRCESRESHSHSRPEEAS
jgi:hypothetical protein